MGRRIVILGNSGSGKSTLARRIGAALDIPVTHLDALYWRPGWVRAQLEDFRAAVATAASTDSWVIDGNYSATMDLRLPLADTVVFLDVSRSVSLYRVFRRQLREHGRDTQAPGCVSKVDAELLTWIWQWPPRRTRMLDQLAEEAPATRQVLLSTRRDVRAFLADLH
ncbi:P-loop NTPase family protein [Amycolatopsis jiangsuensis]|uniref:Adenylate kinase family enzyme n=1 Tax=Amycolatopsis jiangsuensis TaxID=1181879 RepID=A0A840J141_9PSEU|nr:DNA topology modulation protein FlaR [Amycolatopsis jiangsuensis]MBB4687365.1 adenylate kinase family enzyme [Amycolatopsis jiangsuensis]